MSVDAIYNSNLTPQTTMRQPSANSNALNDVSIEDFLKLMITELKNQDPLNPMDNAQILEQVGQMQAINSSIQLRETLQGVLLGQNLSSSSNLIGAWIYGLAADGSDVTGMVEAVTVKDGVPQLLVGNQTVSLNNVKAVAPGG